MSRAWLWFFGFSLYLHLVYDLNTTRPGFGNDLNSARLVLTSALFVPQGLFRLAAAASVVKRLKTCLDQETVDHSEFSMDPHAVAGK